MREMKDSGVEWIGEIPCDWKLERSQWHLEEVNISNNPVQTNNVLSLTNKLGVVPYEEKGNQGNKSKENVYEYKLAYPNTIVANSMNILIGSVGLCDYFGCVSPVYYVFRAKKYNNIKFLNYVFQTVGFQRELRKYANGILEIRLRVSASDILKRFIPFPSENEQQRIAEFLDRACGEIDGLKADIQAQIDTLEQYKRSVITEAVTHGLNPSAPMKDSGIPWGDKIPQNWEEARVKYVAICLKKGNGITKEDIVENGDTPCVRYGEIYTKYDLSFSECTTRTNKEIISSKQYFKQGDILFAGTGELIEEIGKNIVYLGAGECLAGGDIIILKHKQNAKYLNYALNAECMQAQKSCNKAKLKVVHISAFEIGNIRIAIPPLDEQQKIADYLDNKCAEIEQIIADKKSQIETLDSYKKSLIYEYVTGKKEVV